MRRILTCCGVFTLVALLAVAAAVHADPTDKVVPPPASAPLASVPGGNVVPSPSAPSTPTKTATVDELLAKLEELKAQREVIEKQEADIKAELKDRVKAQKQRMKNLAVTEEEEQRSAPTQSTSFSPPSGVIAPPPSALPVPSNNEKN